MDDEYEQFERIDSKVNKNSSKNNAEDNSDDLDYKI